MTKAFKKRVEMAAKEAGVTIGRDHHSAYVIIDGDMDDNELSGVWRPEDGALHALAARLLNVRP